jgi:cyclophilin family peptidyl-prolyl cis-trans isomerase
LSYERCPIHRIVKDSWLQSGDVVDGSGSNSIVAPSPKNSDNNNVIPDECFSADFGFEFGGIVGLSNTGPHTNGSQFFITLGPSDWMNNQFVGIGRLVYGYKTLQAINNMKVTSMQRPESEIIIKACGIEYGRESN